MRKIAILIQQKQHVVLKTNKRQVKTSQITKSLKNSFSDIKQESNSFRYVL